MQEEAFLKRYLEYCRSRSAPVLSETAGRVLANEYVELREEVRSQPSTSRLRRPRPITKLPTTKHCMAFGQCTVGLCRYGR